ncbi:RES domain-containing protein [Nakamurella panacisegetis]|uniref:RES domain-containing protein n=1 Tax=Nakamurella panacisegetis TaxID=1090615 RepID=A0A1H0KWR0_9ACTN|nr:RES family NAD+ phosphorylase [Nakamurella panacisegetis]SDO60222.1 RES domain-containing protein [Nakamurella panacisegetis]
MVKLPRQPGTLHIDEADLGDWPHHAMVRIHGTVGALSLPWHELRHFGPTSNRFDPHPPPPGMHADFAASYVAADVDTALAEVFQDGRIIAPSAPNGPYLTVWRATRALRLLDLRGSWPLREGASHVINTGPRPVCRQWAHAIALHPIDVDGLLYTSSMTGADAAALFRPSADSFPEHPLLSLPLTDPGLAGVLDGAAARIGYALT